eukprot:PITA_29269
MHAGVHSGKDYDVWAIRTTTTLQAHDVWDYVKFGFSELKYEEEEQALSNTEREQWRKDKKKNAHALQLIQQGVDRTVFQKIMITSSTKVAWDTLVTNYKGMDKVNSVKLQNTMRDFESLQMKETKDIDSFMNQVIIVVNQLKIYGEDIKDQRVVENVFRSFSTKFDVVVAAIEEAKDLASLTNDELMGSLLSHEARIDRNKDSTLQTAFKSQVSISRDKGRRRGRSGRYGGQRDDREEHEHGSGNNYKSFKNN